MKKYVFQCIKNQVSSYQFGLGGKSYKKGQYVTENGEPTNNLQKAFLYTKETDNSEDIKSFNLFFKKVEVKICLVK